MGIDKALSLEGDIASGSSESRRRHPSGGVPPRLGERDHRFSATQMVPHVRAFPDGERSIEDRVHPRVPLPPNRPRGKVISGTHGGETQDRRVDAGLQTFVTTVTENGDHVWCCSITSGQALCLASRGIGRIFQPLMADSYAVKRDHGSPL